MCPRTRLSKTLAALFLALAGACVSPSPVLADDPPPMDPATDPSGGGTNEPYVATPEQWEWATAEILAVYPDADYTTICYYALSWYNMLPPDYSEDPNNTTEPPPPL